MATGRDEWKSTGQELGGAFVNLAKSLVRTGLAGAEKAESEGEVVADAEIISEETI